MRTRPPAEASRRDEDGAAGEGVTEGQQSRTSVQPSCCDDGQGVGIGTGAPLGTEPAGDFAEDHAGPQGTLAVVVGGGHVAAGDEDKEITAAFADTAGELLAGLGGGADGEQAGEPAGEVGAVLDPGAGVAAAAVSGVPARASILAIAPSLRRTPNTSSSSRTSRSNPIAWVTCRCRISATRLGPKGEPGGIPAGGGALKPRRQLGHTPRWR